MLAHWAHYLFPWAFSAHLFHFYLLFFPWAYWLLFLLCKPIGLATSFLGLPRPACFIFTSYPSHGPAGCHSCHSNPLSLLPLFLDFPDPVTSSLLLILPIGLLVVISAMLAIGFTNLLLPFLFLFHSISLIVGLLLLLDFSSKVDINTFLFNTTNN